MCFRKFPQSLLEPPGGLPDRLLLLRLPAVRPPPGTVPNQVVRANTAIYGTKDAGRHW